MDALRINEPFGNNFRSPRSDPTALSHCFELSIARVTAFCPNYRIRFADRSIIETNTFYLTPREHEIVQLPRAIKRYSEYFSKICGTEER